MSSALFSGLSLREMSVANRIVVSPMCQYGARDGSATNWHLVHLGQMSISGAGLVVMEATHVEARGRITPACLGLYSDENEAALAPVIAFCREHGAAKLGIQLSHAGRKGSARVPWEQRGAPLDAASGGWPTRGCSGLPRAEGWPVPEALDAAGLREVKDAHVAATRRARRLGLDFVELSAAHGYLLHEFLSPLTNRRADDYGGDLAGRLRYPLEIFAAMREAWPAEKPMGVRISATDWLEGGWDVPEAVVFCQELRALGCDYIAVSTGGLSLAQQVPLGEGHQIPFAATIRREADVPTMAVGMIHRPRHAEAVIAEGQADFVALARGMLANPRWPWHAAAVLDADVDYPPQHVRAYKSAWLRNPE